MWVPELHMEHINFHVLLSLKGCILKRRFSATDPRYSTIWGRKIFTLPPSRHSAVFPTLQWDVSSPYNLFVTAERQRLPIKVSTERLCRAEVYKACPLS